MKFVSRFGDPLSERQWRELFADPKYSLVERTELASGLVAETTWVGVAMAHEGDEPLLYLTEAYRAAADPGKADKRADVAATVWHHTERGAQKAHGALARALGKGE